MVRLAPLIVLVLRQYPNGSPGGRPATPSGAAALSRAATAPGAIDVKPAKAIAEPAFPSNARRDGSTPIHFSRYYALRLPVPARLATHRARGQRGGPVYLDKRQPHDRLAKCPMSLWIRCKTLLPSRFSAIVRIAKRRPAGRWERWWKSSLSTPCARGA